MERETASSTRRTLPLALLVIIILVVSAAVSILLFSSFAIPVETSSNTLGFSRTTITDGFRVAKNEVRGGGVLFSEAGNKRRAWQDDSEDAGEGGAGSVVGSMLDSSLEGQGRAQDGYRDGIHKIDGDKVTRPGFLHPTA